MARRMPTTKLLTTTLRRIPKRGMIHEPETRPAKEEKKRPIVESRPSWVLVAPIDTAYVGRNPNPDAKIVYIPSAETTDAQIRTGRRTAVRS